MDNEEGGNLVGVKTLVVDVVGGACSTSLSDEMIIMDSSIVSGTSVVSITSDTYILASGTTR